MWLSSVLGMGVCFIQNDYPFPYRISIEVSGADQSSIDAIRRVGGEVVIVYRNRLNLRAHVKPYKFEVLPRTVRLLLTLPCLLCLRHRRRKERGGVTHAHVFPGEFEEVSNVYRSP